MKKINNGDVLLFLDAGCEIDIRKKDKIKEMFDIVQRDYIIGTEVGSGYLEKFWTKRDVFVELNCDSEKYWNSIQRQSGVNLFLKCDKTVKLVNEWRYFAHKYNLFDNSKSINKNHKGFKCNRHDQSVFSLLTKKYNLYSNHTLHSCIDVLRNRSGKSKIK